MPNLPEFETEWVVDTERIQTFSTNESMKILLQTLSPKKQQILDYINTHHYKAWFHSSVQRQSEDDDRCLYELSEEVLAEVHEYNAGWSVEVYQGNMSI